MQDLPKAQQILKGRTWCYLFFVFAYPGGRTRKELIVILEDASHNLC